MKHLLLLLLLLPFSALSQVTGTILEKETKEPVYGAKIVASSGQKVLSDMDGRFTITPSSYPVTIVVSAQTLLTDI